MEKKKYINISESDRKALILIFAIISLLSLVATVDKAVILPRLDVAHLFILVFIYHFYDRFYFKGEKINKINCIMAVFFSVIFLLGDAFTTASTAQLLFDGAIQTIKTIIKFAGYYMVIYILIKELYAYIQRLSNKSNSKEDKALTYIFEKYPNRCIILILLIVWLPIMIIMYPGIISNDSADQIRQVIDPNLSLYNHHPILSSLIMGNLVKLGEFIKFPDLGLYVYVLLQTAFLIYTILYSFKLMRKMNISVGMQLAALVFYALCPLIWLYTFNVIKDVVFRGLHVLLYFNANRDDYRHESLREEKLFCKIFSYHIFDFYV